MLSNVRRLTPPSLILLWLVFGSQAMAHVVWTRVNATDEELLGLYHFDTAAHQPGEYFQAAGCLAPERDLLIAVPSGAGATTPADLPSPIFGPSSLLLVSTQYAETDQTLSGGDTDATVEFWFKWDAAMTSSSLEVGWRSSAKLRLTRDRFNSGNDQLGISATHGDFRPVPGFTNWVDVGPEEGPLGEWVHLAMAVHSTGQHFDADLAHDIYNTGSLARFYVNGHLVGTTLDITGMRAHGESKLIIRNLAGTIHIDEVAIWRKDWSSNGTVTNPFGDGRGDGGCPEGSNAARNWTGYE